MDQRASGLSQTSATRRWAIPCLTLLFVVVASGYYWHVRSEPFNQMDTDEYIKMAQGRSSEVIKPFTNRILCPGVAGFISRTTGWSVDTSFFVTTMTCAAVWVSVGLSWIQRRTGSLALAAAIVLSPMALGYAREIYSTDCMHAAFTALFFLMIARGTWWYAMPLLFLLQLTRESTMLLTLVVVLVSAYHRKWKLAGTAFLVTVLGIVVVANIAKEGKGNIHEANTAVYLVGKFPFNFLTNVCGIRMWTNTHAKNYPLGYPNEPMVKIQLPDWVPTGNMRQVGIYDLDPLAPPKCAGVMTTILGVMPTVALFVIFWRRRRLVRDDRLPFITLLSLCYGMLAFLLGPSEGAGYIRLTSHGWPLAWIAAPELLAYYFNSKNNNRFIRQLVWLQIISSWTLLVIQEYGRFFEWGDKYAPLELLSGELIIAALVVSLPCHAIAIKVLGRNRLPDAGLEHIDNDG